MSDRRKDYKPSLSAEVGAMRRREVTNDLRRDRRERLLHAKRRKVGEDGAGGGGGGGGAGAGGGGAGGGGAPGVDAVGDEELGLALGALVAGGGASRPGEERTRALRVVRRALSGSGGEGRAAGLLAGGLGPVLARVLAGAASDGAGALEAAWCVTNIACGGEDEVAGVLPCGPALVALLASDASPLAEQAAWAIGNIAAESEGARRALAANGAPAALARAMGSRSPRVARTAAWAACSLLRDRAATAAPYLAGGALRPILAALESAAGDDGSGGGADAGYVADMAWVLTYLTAKEEAVARSLVEAGVIAALVPLLGSGEGPLTCPALRAIGNCVSLAAEFGAAAIAQPGFLRGCAAALASPDLALAKETAWTLSNVMAGGREACGAVVAAGLVPPLAAAAVSGTFPVRREALFALHNLALVDEGLALLLGDPAAGALVGAYVGIISAPDAALARLGLSFVGRVLDAAPGGVDLVAANGGADALEEAQYRLQQSELGGLARWLLARHFEGDDDGGGGEAPWGGEAPPPLPPATAAAGGMGRGAHMAVPAWVAAGAGGHGGGDAAGAGRGSAPGARQATLGEFGFSA